MNSYAVRMLLDFRANPMTAVRVSKKLPVNNPEEFILGTVLVALRIGHYVGALMMLTDCHVSMTEVEFGVAFIAAIKSRRRECLAVLLQDRRDKILGKFQGKSLIWHAINSRTDLLSMVVAYAKGAAERTDTALPPRDVRGDMKAKFAAAMRLADVEFPMEKIEKEVAEIQSPWKPLPD